MSYVMLNNATEYLHYVKPNHKGVFGFCGVFKGQNRHIVVM